jgi:predicted MFS family arabinose efflux permease
MTAATPAGEGTAAYRVRALVILTLMYTCAAVDRNVMALVLEPIKREFGLDDAQLGLLAGGSFAVSFAVAALPLGWWLDRRHRVRTLAALVTVWSLCTALCVSARSYWGLLLLRGGVGAAESGASPAALSLLSDIFPPRQRATAMGVYNAGTAAGVVLAFGLGGWIAQHHGWRAVMLIAGLPGLVLAVALLLIVREPARAGGPLGGTGAPPFTEVARFAAGQRALRHVLAGAMLAACVNAGIVSWLASFLFRVHGVPVHRAGLIVALTLGLLGMAGAMGAGWLADRAAARGGPRMRVHVCALSMLMSVPFGLVFLLADSLVWALPAMAAWGVLVIAYIGPTFATSLSLVPPRMRSVTAAAQQLLAVLVGTGIGPWLVGVGSDRLGGGPALRHAMVLVMLIAGWAAWHFYRSSRSLDADLQRAAQHAGA